MLSLFLRQRLRELLGDIGEVRSLVIDSSAHDVQMSIVLEGEAEPVRIHVTRYALTRDGKTLVLTFDEVETSRVWVNRALHRFLPNPRFEIPDEYADIAERLLG